MTQQEKAKELGYKYFPNEENVWASDNVEATKTTAACMEMSSFIIDKICEWLREWIYNGQIDVDGRVFIEEFKKDFES